MEYLLVWYVVEVLSVQHPCGDRCRGCGAVHEVLLFCCVLQVLAQGDQSVVNSKTQHLFGDETQNSVYVYSNIDIKTPTLHHSKSPVSILVTYF